MNLLFRFFYIIFKGLLFRTKMSFHDTSVLNFRVYPTDLDLNFHMNNGRFLTIMDIGRTDLIFRFGMDKLLVKEKLVGVATAVNIVFLKSLAPFEKYQLHSKALTWDDNWFYVEQSFLNKKLEIVASAIVKLAFKKQGKRVNPSSIVDKLDIYDGVYPGIPKYLEELIKGEEYKLEILKEHNRQAKQRSKK